MTGDSFIADNLTELTPGESRMANCVNEVRERNDHLQLRTTPSLAGGAEEREAMTCGPLPPTLPAGLRCAVDEAQGTGSDVRGNAFETSTSGSLPASPASRRPRTILGDYRPAATTPFRCEGCSAPARRPLTPEEIVLCDGCLAGAPA